MSSFTKKAIADAFGQLLQENAIDKITVTQIAENAGISRLTFYYHFQDIYDLISWIWAEQIAMAENEVKNISENPECFMDRLFGYAAANKKIMLHAYDSHNRYYYDRIAVEKIIPLVRSEILSFPESEGAAEDKLDFLVKTFSKLMTSMFLDWMDAGMPDENVREKNDYAVFFSSCITATLKNFT